MSTDLLKEIEPLLLPIKGKNPGGVDLRYDKVHDEIKNYRSEDDEELPRGVWERDLKQAEWDKVERTCVDALKNKSKDLQISAWLLEAWIKRENFNLILVP